MKNNILAESGSTFAHVHCFALQTLASEACERLPIYSPDGTKKIYEAQSVSKDWTDPDEHH